MSLPHIHVCAKALAAALLGSALSAQQAASRPTTRADTRPVDAAGLLTGIDEEEFKKLHDLRKDSAPPRKGFAVKIGTERAYLSLPENQKAPLPAVLVIHEFWGLNEHVEHWCDRLAAAGYAALAVDLYKGKVATTRDDASKFMREVNREEAVTTMRSAHAFLASEERVKATRTAALGWCFGGAMALQAGLNLPDLDAVVMYYGRPVTDAEELKKLNAPLLGIFGNRDRSIPPKSVDEFEAALLFAGKKPEIRRYDAEHAFANPSAQAYDKENAKAAYAAVLRFLGEHLR